MKWIHQREQLDPAVCQAILARRLALSVLTRPPIGDAGGERAEKMPLESSEGWDLFLRTERCAYPLKEALSRTGVLEHLLQSCQRSLRREAEWEIGRVASARRQLRDIAAWAMENGCRPVVLKGGVPALDTRCVDLNDVDVLLPFEDAEKLFAWLSQRGYEPSSSPGGDHLTGVTRPGEIEIEVHYALDGEGVDASSGFGSRLQELSAAPGIWRLAPADHLWHVLEHQVVRHPSRRGRVRDLLLLQHAFASCSSADVDSVRHRARQHPFSGTFTVLLDHAARWLQGASPEDPFEEIASVGYVLARRKENRSKVYPTLGLTNAWIYAHLLGSPERRAKWDEIRSRSADLSGYRAIRRTQVLSPSLGRLLQLVVRVVSFSATYVRAYPMAQAIRRRVQRHLRRVTASAAGG